MKSAQSAKSADRNPESEIRDWPQADDVMERYADLAAQRSARLAEHDRAVAELVKRCGRDTAALDGEMGSLEFQLKEFTDSRKPEFKASPDGDGRSYSHAGVSIGFRKLLDKVGLPRGDSKKQVTLEYLAQYRPEFVRRTPEFDLVKLLAALKDGDTTLIQALEEHDIKLKLGKDEFFLKVNES